MKEIYNSTLDNYSKTVTLVFGILFIALISTLIYKVFIYSTSSSHFLNITLIVFIIIFVSILASFYPKRIILKKNGIQIDKVIGTINIPFTNINSISSVSSYPIAMTISSKGFLGYLGRTMDGGQSYVTNAKKAIMIKTENKGVYLISIDKKDEFIKSVKEYLK